MATPRGVYHRCSQWLYNLTRQGIGHTGIQDEEASLEDRSRTAPNTSPYTARTQTYDARESGLRERSTVAPRPTHGTVTGAKIKMEEDPRGKTSNTAAD